MATVRQQRLAWELARSQRWVITHAQLLELGFTEAAIRWRIAAGRLHTIHRGVYAVGRPQVTQEGGWMAAVLRCGPDAYLSHPTAAAHWRLQRAPRGAPIHISLVADVSRRAPEIRIHRRPSLTDADLTTHRGIPVTTPTRTLIDLAPIVSPNQLEAAVNEADVLGLIDPENLRAELDGRRGQRGVPALRTLLDRHTFRLTESELERRFLRIVRRAGLPLPETQQHLSGRTDFYWPELDLVVETDGWRYHRTPARQASDNRRMQAHLRAGRTAVRFSHFEIRYEASRVEDLLSDLIARLSAR